MGMKKVTTRVGKRRKGQLYTMAERRLKVVSLVTQGKGFEEIGAALGCSGKTACLDYHAVMDRLAAETSETTEELRRIKHERYRTMLAALWPAILQGDTQAIDKAVKVEQADAALFGLNAPTKIAATNPEGTEAAPFVIALPEGWGSAGDATGGSAGADVADGDHTEA